MSDAVSDFWPLIEMYVAYFMTCGAKGAIGSAFASIY